VSVYTIGEKLDLLAKRRQQDQILAVRQVQYPIHQEVMVIDDPDAAYQALSD
jgi:hypothetical protein